MRNLKKFLALVLAMMMAFSLMVTANAAVTENVTYPDDGSVLEEFEDAVTVLSGMGVFRGDNGNFKPQASIMRCEAVAILYRLVTGDVNDTQVQLYAPLAAYFKDVKTTDWFAPYVGFAVDAGYIKGYNGNFNPYSNVTGYEMLAMLLRAVGYGKNGEFTGAQWRINVGAQAESLNVLKDIKSTHYANTLSQASAREVVADLTFRVAADVPTVRYELGYYNPYIGVAVANGSNQRNQTLGEREFGLTNYNGHVIGNQATGENGTILDGGYYTVNTTGVVVDDYGNTVYLKKADGSIITRYTAAGAVVAEWATAAADDGTNYEPLTAPTGSTYAVNNNYAWGSGNTKFNFNTGLGMFGHSASVWYDSRNRGSKGYDTYAIIDKANHVATVYAEDGVLANSAGDGKLAAAAKAAGFSVQPDDDNANFSQAHFSDRYSQLGILEKDIATTGQVSPVNMYSLVSNNNGKSVDVVIALSIEVANIRQKNTTAATPYVVLGSNTANTSKFGNGTTAGTINLEQLTPDTKEEQKAIGALVTVYEVAGTGETLATAKTKATQGDADFMYQFDPMKTVTKTVANYKASATALDSQNPHVTEVNFADGTSMKLSGITRGDGTNSKIISEALPVVGSLLASTTYTVFEDIMGRFISMVPASNYKFLYGTFADYVIGGLGTGTIGYNMVGVDWDGKIQAENTLKSINATGISGNNYNDLTVTKKDQGTVGAGTWGNELLDGYDTGYMYNAATGDIDDGTNVTLDGTALADGSTWTVTATDAKNGFAKVLDGATELLLTKDTKFIIVSGTGTATLKVDIAEGLTGLLAGGTSAEITKVAAAGAPGPYAEDQNQVIFRTDAQKYGTVDTAKNGVVTEVILSDGNLTRFNTETLFFNFDEVTDTGLVLPGANAAVKQFELWNNGEQGYYFVDTRVSTKVDTTLMSAAPGSEMEAKTFYTLAKVDEVNGTPVYKAVAQTNATNLSYAEGFNADTVTYKYVTVTNLETGLFGKGSGDLVFDITKAKVCDVDWVKTTGVSAARSQITNVVELNNAVSVKQVNPGTAVYTVEVAVVYSGAEMGTIYVLDT